MWYMATSPGSLSASLLGVSDIFQAPKLAVHSRLFSSQLMTPLSNASFRPRVVLCSSPSSTPPILDLFVLQPVRDPLGPVCEPAPPAIRCTVVSIVHSTHPDVGTAGQSWAQPCALHRSYYEQTGCQRKRCTSCTVLYARSLASLQIGMLQLYEREEAF